MAGMTAEEERHIWGSASSQPGLVHSGGPQTVVGLRGREDVEAADWVVRGRGCTRGHPEPLPSFHSAESAEKPRKKEK